MVVSVRSRGGWRSSPAADVPEALHNEIGQKSRDKERDEPIHKAEPSRDLST